jgi:hypothetical protein
MYIYLVSGFRSQQRQKADKRRAERDRSKKESEWLDIQ